MEAVAEVMTVVVEEQLIAEAEEHNRRQEIMRKTWAWRSVFFCAYTRKNFSSHCAANRHIGSGVFESAVAKALAGKV